MASDNLHYDLLNQLSDRLSAYRAIRYCKLSELPSDLILNLTLYTIVSDTWHFPTKYGPFFPISKANTMRPSASQLH